MTKTASSKLTAQVMLGAYANGIFPMAEARDSSDLHWVDPRFRGVFPLDRLHVSRSLRRRILAGGFEVMINRDFAGVVSACAARKETWINADLYRVYMELNTMGKAHSLEVYADGELTGGVFGIAMGCVFFGESMFSRKVDASKIALVFLRDHLRCSGFRLFDTQFLTPHLASLGAVEISRASYRDKLHRALQGMAQFGQASLPEAQELLQRTTQTS